SAGRVQSVALKLVVDREVEIEKFVPEEYWNVNAMLKKGANEIKTSLATFKKKKFVPKNKEEIDAMLSVINGKDFVVKEVKKAKTKSHAPAPFTTSTMQQDALNKLGMSLAKTTAAAQQLYEGVEVKGEGKIALITYIRTDSVRVSTDAQNACREFIKNKYGADFVPEKPNIYHTKDSAQDAHEAIRPITMDITPEMVKETLTSDNYKLYKLIYERFLASQMSEAQYASVTVNFDCQDYGFKVSGKTMEFPGYTNVYKEFVEEENKEGLAGRLPVIEEGDSLPCTKILPEQKFTKPPTRYTEATLVKAMEEKGIGRPATYSATITILSTRKYTQKEGKYLVPTELGRKITAYLDQFFAGVINVKFTAYMEGRLDDIASKDEDWKEVVSSFWNGFERLLVRADASSVTMKEPPKETDIICEKCGSKMLIRNGRFGEFLACSNFPKCKNTRPLDQTKKIAGKCPECGADMVERKSKKGKTFYSCDRYPDCKFMSWDITTGAKCPKCQSPLIRKGNLSKCSSASCDYKENNA
ncbi:MAG: type I DNA topoisomerase, partial [Clostridia bacterium]|nr:type I DNA topoisomerase [Clostridia bacterium]